jgi:hypothetical protein
VRFDLTCDSCGRTRCGARKRGSNRPDTVRSNVLRIARCKQSGCPRHRTFTAFVENMDRSLAFFQRHPIPKTESLRLLKKLLVLQTDFVDQLGVDDDALL